MGLRIGVVGAGGMGREHITNLATLDDVEILVVSDIVEQSAESAAALVGAAATTDSDSVVTRSDLDAVVIASPDETHADLTIAAIETGLAVLCEKPLASNLADAERVAAAEASAAAPMVQLGFMRQYDPAHLQVAAALPGLGAVQHLRSVHRNTNHEWVRELDVIVSQSVIHDVHTAHWLTGSEFASVVTQVVRSGPRVDHVVILGAMENGATVTLEFAEATYGYDVELEVTCQGGMVVAAQPGQPAVRTGGASHRHIGEDWFGRFTQAYHLEVADWVSGVMAGELSGPSVADGLAAQRVVAAALESAETRNRVMVN